MVASLSQAGDAAAVSTIVHTCPVQAHGHADGYLVVSWEGKHLQRKKQSRLSSVAASFLPARPRTASSAGKLNAVDVSFFNMHAMTCNFSGFLCQIPRPDCLETNLDQRLKALRDASQSWQFLPLDQTPARSPSSK